jgi:hypothetical protein
LCALCTTCGSLNSVATEALPKIAVFDWLAQALELARTDG